MPVSTSFGQTFHDDFFETKILEDYCTTETVGDTEAVSLPTPPYDEFHPDRIALREVSQNGLLSLPVPKPWTVRVHRRRSCRMELPEPRYDDDGRERPLDPVMNEDGACQYYEFRRTCTTEVRKYVEFAGRTYLYSVDVQSRQFYAFWKLCGSEIPPEPVCQLAEREFPDLPPALPVDGSGWFWLPKPVRPEVTPVKEGDADLDDGALPGYTYTRTFEWRLTYPVLRSGCLILPIYEVWAVFTGICNEDPSREPHVKKKFTGTHRDIQFPIPNCPSLPDRQLRIDEPEDVGHKLFRDSAPEFRLTVDTPSKILGPPARYDKQLTPHRIAVTVEDTAGLTPGTPLTFTVQRESFPDYDPGPDWRAYLGKLRHHDLLLQVRGEVFESRKGLLAIDVHFLSLLGLAFHGADISAPDPEPRKTPRAAAG